jgi:excisionase family DNA binding protein
MNLSLSEAARLLGKSDRQVRYLITSGKLSARKVDGRWAIRREDLPLSPGQEKAARQKTERAARLALELLDPDADTRRLGEWLWAERRLRLNPRKGHVRPAELRQSYLGYRVSRQGQDLGPKAVRRFRRQLPSLVAAGDRDRIRRTLASWRGTMEF